MFRNYHNSYQNSAEQKQIIDAIKENDYNLLDNSLKNSTNVKDANYKLDINQSDTQKEERTDNFINDRITLLHVAAFFDSLECFVFLHKTKKLNIQSLSVKSFLPLHYACFNSSREVAAYILNEDPEQVKIPQDNSLFNFTILGGDPVILTELFNKGATITKKTSDDPLEKSIALDCFELCKIILEHYEGFTKKTTPALIAAEMCNPMLLDFLVRSPSDLLYSSDAHESVFTLIFKLSDGTDFKDVIYGWLTKFTDLSIEPPIVPGTRIDGVCHWVCKLGNPEIARLMLETNEISINRIGDNNHIGPYYLASNKKFKVENVLKILQILIDKGFDLNYQENTKTETALEIFVNSIFSNKNKVIDFLLAHGSSPYSYFTKRDSTTIYDFVKKSNNKPLIDIFNKYI